MHSLHPVATRHVAPRLTHGRGSNSGITRAACDTPTPLSTHKECSSSTSATVPAGDPTFASTAALAVVRMTERRPRLGKAAVTDGSMAAYCDRRVDGCVLIVALSGWSCSQCLLNHAIVSSSPPHSEALDTLQLKRYCCRRMLLTHVDLIEKLLNYAPLEK